MYGWHNKFVEVRQRGRASLQQALYERSEGRHKARSFGKMAANLSQLLAIDLEAVRGKKVPYASVAAGPPANPYGKMERTWNAIEESRKARTQKALTLDPTELKALQRFYDQLCALVEAQKMSDPLCLMVVHKVRDLLESGVVLHKSLLTAVSEHVATFTKSTGLLRHNRFILSVLTYIAKCTGVSEMDLEDVVAGLGIQIVVYGALEVPSAMEERSRPSSSLVGPRGPGGAGSYSRGGAGSRSSKRGAPIIGRVSGQPSSFSGVGIGHILSSTGLGAVVEPFAGRQHSPGGANPTPPDGGREGKGGQEQLQGGTPMMGSREGGSRPNRHHQSMAEAAGEPKDMSAQEKVSMVLTSALRF